MKTLKYFAMVGLVALAVGGVFVLTARAAQSATNGAPGGKWRERVKQKLNLTDDQLGQIRSALKSEKSNLTVLLNRLREARTDLRAAIQKPDATEASVREAAAKLSAVESDLAVERLKLYGKISPILTADQRAKLAELQAGIDQFIERTLSRFGSKTSE